jgi:proteasome lid subunit RPN8/RPN11
MIFNNTKKVFNKPISWKIKKMVLQSIMYLSKNNFPNEFGAMLVADNFIINDIYIIPATKENSNSVIIRTDLVPMSIKVTGSVHSHPSGFGRPSRADINFFSKKFINIISYPPFNLNDFKAYNKKGKLINLEIIG